jgi:SNF2 family DNA or RNA helicase
MFYPDIWQHIANFLTGDDLFSMATTCKTAYKIMNRSKIREKISFPLKCPKRLTYDQRETIQQMEKLPINVKLVNGDVGSGKTIVALAYGLRKDFDKIILVVPPNLIIMWKETCEKFFGYTPYIIHNTNKKYHYGTEREKKNPPDEKIIIISYTIFNTKYLKWLNNGSFLNKKEPKENNNLIIIDEAHHTVHLDGVNFKEVVALSATVNNAKGVTYGIFNLLRDTGKELSDITFNLENKVITKKLPPIIEVQPYKWNLKEPVIRYILKNKSPMHQLSKKSDVLVNNMKDLDFISTTLTHTFLAAADAYFTFSFKIGKKQFTINGNYGQHIFDEKKSIEIFNRYVNQCVKYKQCLAIAEYLFQNTKNDKIVIFDRNINYLPLLHKYLIDNGINSYLFTTHYDIQSRQRQLEKFKSDPQPAVLLSSVEMLGEGHNVTEANHIIFLSTHYNQNIYHQAVGRCHRYPQKKPVYIYHLFNGTMDEKIWEHAYGKCDLSRMNWADLLNK